MVRIRIHLADILGSTVVVDKFAVMVRLVSLDRISHSPSGVCTVSMNVRKLVYATFCISMVVMNATGTVSSCTSVPASQ